MESVKMLLNCFRNAEMPVTDDLLFNATVVLNDYFTATVIYTVLN
jgi:hypothetical protein